MIEHTGEPTACAGVVHARSVAVWEAGGAVLQTNGNPAVDLKAEQQHGMSTSWPCMPRAVEAVQQASCACTAPAHLCPPLVAAAQLLLQRCRCRVAVACDRCGRRGRMNEPGAAWTAWVGRHTLLSPAATTSVAAATKDRSAARPCTRTASNHLGSLPPFQQRQQACTVN